jgi:DNA-binding NtrC family response regulator
MVVLAHGRTIDAADIPADVRGGRGRSLLPAPIPRTQLSPVQGRDVRPELEFVFRTLVDLRVDMDELRREFEAYRRETALTVPDRRRERAPPGRCRPRRWRPGSGGALRGRRHGTRRRSATIAEEIDFAREATQGWTVWSYSARGVTMDELEREAIRAALDAVSGNRRKAAEMLDIGERTLYRKISKYGLEV